MMTLSINGTEYKVKFGYNCFCDTDLLDRVRTVATLFSGSGKEMTEEEIQNTEAQENGVQKMKDLFCIVRELLFVGFKKYNPVETEQESAPAEDAEPADSGSPSAGVIAAIAAAVIAAGAGVAVVLNKKDDKKNK